MGRYKDGNNYGNYQVQSRNFWTTPACLMEALQQGFNVEIEKICLPLELSPRHGLLLLAIC